MSLFEIAGRHAHLCIIICLIVTCIALVARRRAMKKAFILSRAADQAVIAADKDLILIQEQIISTQAALIRELSDTADGLANDLVAAQERLRISMN